MSIEGSLFWFVIQPLLSPTLILRCKLSPFNVNCNCHKKLSLETVTFNCHLVLRLVTVEEERKAVCDYSGPVSLAAGNTLNRLGQNNTSSMMCLTLLFNVHCGEGSIWYENVIHWGKKWILKNFRFNSIRLTLCFTDRQRDGQTDRQTTES